MEDGRKTGGRRLGGSSNEPRKLQPNAISYWDLTSHPQQPQQGSDSLSSTRTIFLARHHVAWVEDDILRPCCPDLCGWPAQTPPAIARPAEALVLPLRCCTNAGCVGQALRLQPIISADVLLLSARGAISQRRCQQPRGTSRPSSTACHSAHYSLVRSPFHFTPVLTKVLTVSS